eukprot:scaffold269071_cov13-Tisochrysis_lutea.AAC.1
MELQPQHFASAAAPQDTCVQHLSRLQASAEAANRNISITLCTHGPLQAATIQDRRVQHWRAIFQCVQDERLAAAAAQDACVQHQRAIFQCVQDARITSFSQNGSYSLPLQAAAPKDTCVQQAAWPG